MRQSKFTETQIVSMLKEADAGRPVNEIWRSRESNGLVEAFFGSFKRDVVYQACLETVEDVARQLLGWIEHYNHQAPHSALGIQSPAECYAMWLVRNKTRPVQH
jgi:transposase InsO family protein